MNRTEDLLIDELWDSGRGSVLVHVVMNDLGVIGSVAKTLLEGWTTLPELQRDDLLRMIDVAVDRGLERLRMLALAA